jgi:hypothetical protein
VAELDPKLARLSRLRAELPYFAKECLRVRDKAGQIEPLVFNAAQEELHARLEAQREEHGWVRALVLKGRQQGISTYVGGRYYHKASMRGGVVVYILSHEQASSDKLFAMVDRYQRFNPLAPHVGASNAKELIFDKLESSYAVATAGSKEGGRGSTSSLLHGSEVGFWANAPAHFAASVQRVPLLAGTEVILESTSAGASGEFYERWQDAEAGRGDYIPIFLPWWLSKEYSRPPPAGFELQKEPEADGEMSEQEYADTWKLAIGQMCWRRNKIIELRSLETFKREYPADPSEAWTAPPGMEPMIASVLVMRARKRTGIDGVGPLILGVDPASNGGDRFSISARRGNRVLWTLYRNKINHIEGTAWVKTLIDELRPARVNIDAGNIGADIITGLRSCGPRYVEVVRGVNFGATSQAKVAQPKVPGPKNRRAEMWKRLLEWLMQAEGVQIPDMGALQSDICAPKLIPQLNNDFLLESKMELKKRGIRSPDLADSIALTFAFNEFFTSYASGDAPPVRYGDTTGLRPDVSPSYAPLPPTGGFGWMG